MSETIYFVHMYFVAFCSLVLYKENYRNLSHILFVQVGQLSLHYFAEFIKVKRGNEKWVNTLERTVSVAKPELH